MFKTKIRNPSIFTMSDMIFVDLYGFRRSRNWYRSQGVEKMQSLILKRNILILSPQSDSGCKTIVLWLLSRPSCNKTGLQDKNIGFEQNKSEVEITSELNGNEWEHQCVHNARVYQTGSNRTNPPGDSCFHCLNGENVSIRLR